MIKIVFGNSTAISLNVYIVAYHTALHHIIVKENFRISEVGVLVHSYFKACMLYTMIVESKSFFSKLNGSTKTRGPDISMTDI